MPAEHEAGRGDHPAGRGEPDDRAVPGVALDRLLPDPGHQEDVVVDAQGDQEHEHEQRERGVRAAEAEYVVEEEGADAEGGGEREHHRGGQDQRRHQRPQQQPEDDEHHRQDERDDDGTVMRGRAFHVQGGGRGPADQGVGAGDGVHRGPHPVDRVYAAWLSGGAVSVPCR